MFRQRLYKIGNLLESEQGFVVRVAPQGSVVNAPAPNFHFCPKLLHQELDPWFSRGVPFSTASGFLVTPLTFPTYVFIGYPIDGKPAISSFKELLSRSDV